MDFTEHFNTHAISIDHYSATSLCLNGKIYTHPVILGDNIYTLPESQFEALSLDSFQIARDAQAEIIIIGTGSSLKSLNPKLLVELNQLGIGVECMNTASACRTIMMLQSEGRNVWAWLWI